MSESESLTLQPSDPVAPLAAVAHEARRPPIGRAVAGAVLAAALGAAAWALMVIVTDHSFGIAAAALGILSGQVVHRFAGAGAASFRRLSRPSRSSSPWSSASTPRSPT